ncbi:hypothetical protein BH11ARM2_BH11ARM2_31420 [soil metagenome]
MMRPLLSILLFLGAGLASAQVVATRDNGAITIRGQLAGYKLNPDRSTRYILTGTAGQPAMVTQKTEEGTTELSATQTLDFTLKTGTDENGKKREYISVAKAEGGVRMTRTLTDPQSRGATVMTGSRADYAGTVKAGTLDMAGPVEITRTDETKNRKLLAKGSRGQAKLLPNDPKSPITVATLVGNVTVDVDQAPYTDPETKKVEAGGQYKAAGDKMVYDLTGDLPKITLTDNVRLEGFTPGSKGNSTGIKSLVMTLTKKGELSEAEAVGGPVETVVTQKKTGGK